MRLWSLHPSLLDKKGLVALWREGLLAQAVLANKTKGYKNHPQLNRFKQHPDPLQAIGSYLYTVAEYADTIGYNFSKPKIIKYNPNSAKIATTQGQLEYEYNHLLNKLKTRDINKFNLISKINLDIINQHPSFIVFEGPIEPWEIIK